MKNLLSKITSFFGGSWKIKYKNIGYVRHARRRMKWRKISEEEVAQVLNDPEQTVPLEENKYHAYKIIGPRNIRVTYRMIDGEIVVLTVVDKSD